MRCSPACVRFWKAPRRNGGMTPPPSSFANVHQLETSHEILPGREAAEGKNFEGVRLKNVLPKIIYWQFRQTYVSAIEERPSTTLPNIRPLKCIRTASRFSASVDIVISILVTLLQTARKISKLTMCMRVWKRNWWRSVRV